MRLIDSEQEAHHFQPPSAGEDPSTSNLSKSGGAPRRSLRTVVTSLLGEVCQAGRSDDGIGSIAGLEESKTLQEGSRSSYLRGPLDYNHDDKERFFRIKSTSRFLVSMMSPGA
jgi:hypothetical protein